MKWIILQPRHWFATELPHSFLRKKQYTPAAPASFPPYFDHFLCRAPAVCAQVASNPMRFSAPGKRVPPLIGRSANQGPDEHARHRPGRRCSCDLPETEPNYGAKAGRRRAPSGASSPLRRGSPAVSPPHSTLSSGRDRRRWLNQSSENDVSGPSGGMVDAGDSKSPAARRVGSSPTLGTNDLAGPSGSARTPGHGVGHRPPFISDPLHSPRHHAEALATIFPEGGLACALPSASEQSSASRP